MNPKLNDEAAPGSMDRVVIPTCACVHSDARTCARWRDGYDTDDPHYHPRYCVCDCHSKDMDDDDWD